MCDGKLTGCQCDAPASRAPLAGCDQQGPTLPVFRSGGATSEGSEVRAACDELITSVCRLKDITDTEEDEFFAQRYLDVMAAIAELTKAVVVYAEPDAGMEPN